MIACWLKLMRLIYHLFPCVISNGMNLHIVHTLACLAGIKGRDAQEMADITSPIRGACSTRWGRV